MHAPTSFELGDKDTTTVCIHLIWISWLTVCFDVGHWCMPHRPRSDVSSLSDHVHCTSQCTHVHVCYIHMYMYERDIVQSLYTAYYYLCMHTHLFVPCSITTIAGQVRAWPGEGWGLTNLEKRTYACACMHYPTRYVLNLGGGGLTYFRWEVATNKKSSAQPSNTASRN